MYIVYLMLDHSVFSLGNNAHGQCGRNIVEGEVYATSQVINRIPVDHNAIKQVGQLVPVSCRAILF